ncbi:hypothetical protein CONLIGDRAFT_686132 [Coniochaeta ligniaria NRRL 30616]|uniref:Uncharacterized protein n=1 Tax=Coniochaeta ligniaria NRRL 30616 TaxID=1408157 RepID=A0A1J7J8R8_9PEZI|nr:hypothetical protein CONLIGDRAFT_686132 [Coniochaeta ligniaria NRRL 30616]
MSGANNRVARPEPAVMPMTPVSPGDDRGDIPIAFAPQRFSTPSPPPAAPIAGSARTTQQHEQQLSQDRFLQVERGGAPRAAMPFMPEPHSPPPPSAKWSRVRELRASIKPSKRLPQPLPSPSVYDGLEGQPSPPPVMSTRMEKNLDIERRGESKRKTLFQRALEGWWELPGLLSRGDTVRGKAAPFPATRKEATGFI